MFIWRFMKKIKIPRRFVSTIAGYDIFISYRHSDAERYAATLHAQLEKMGFHVFRDESEDDNLGTDIHKFEAIACTARCFVTIVSPSVYTSVNVHAELSAYLHNRIGKWYRKPFSRIISIDINQALSNTPQEPQQWKNLLNYVYVPERGEALMIGLPSEEVITRLQKAAAFMNSWRRFVVLITMTIIILSALITTGLTNLAKLRKSTAVSTQRLEQINDSIATLSKRQFLNNIKLRDSLISNKLFTNITYRGTYISNVIYKTCTFLDLYFVGEEPQSISDSGMILEKTVFSNCNFSTVNFDRTHVSESKFENCRFRGGVMNLANFSSTYFFSDSLSVTTDVISAGHVTYFDNCIIDNTDSTFTGMKAKFIDVVFNNCIFKGNFGSLHFIKCSFDACIFPDDVNISALKKNENMVTGYQLYSPQQ